MSILLHYLNTVLIFGILGTGLNLAAGTGGLLNLGHASLAGVGAYTSVLLVMRAGWPWAPAVLAGGALAALFGGLVGAVTLRLRGDYFAIATLGFGVVMHEIFSNWIDVTRGNMGIPGIPAPEVLGYAFRGSHQQALLLAAMLAVVFLIVTRLVHSPWGWTLRAVRDDEYAAAALGKPVLAVRVQAAVLSAFFAGVAGAAQAFYVRYIDPLQFSLNLMVYVLVAVIFGGLGNYRGALLGAAVFVGLQQGLPYLGLPPSIVGAGQQALFSLALLLLMLFRPRGLLPETRLLPRAAASTRASAVSAGGAAAGAGAAGAHAGVEAAGEGPRRGR